MGNETIGNEVSKKASVDRQRDGRFNLYVPRQEGEPADTRPYRGQFDSFGEASDYAWKKFGVGTDSPTLR